MGKVKEEVIKAMNGDESGEAISNADCRLCRACKRKRNHRRAWRDSIIEWGPFLGKEIIIDNKAPFFIFPYFPMTLLLKEVIIQAGYATKIVGYYENRLIVTITSPEYTVSMGNNVLQVTLSGFETISVERPLKEFQSNLYIYYEYDTCFQDRL